MSAVVVKDLEKIYDGKKGVHALRGVSFTVNEGEIFGLLGPNGAGKTTLIKILLGIVKISSGNASVLGHMAGAIEARRQIGYLPEHHRIPLHHTAYTALDYYGGLSGLSTAEVNLKRDDLLKKVGLDGWGKSPIKKFSKGMGQRLGLAQALLHEPQMLILDEPTDGVDPVGRAEIRELLVALKNEGKTIFLNSHLLQEMELICDRVVILDKGLVKREGTISELTSSTAGSAIIFVIDAKDENQIRDTVKKAAIISVKTLPNGTWTVKVEEKDSTTQDDVYDEFRAAKMKVHSFSQETHTLEESFLDIVKNDKDDE
ncbi:MAG: ABC transporter ATP-binding protein [Lentisphaeria bacterium]|nr:ABC transporter ATP-binding protein [Lentisphaeria bacterium]NQZ70728.1 ABC transporter ATP-binding protein [Lentisphaeria bacterium]